MIFSTIKRYAFLGLGLGVTVLGFLAKMFAAKAKRQEKRAERAEDAYEHSVEVMEKDNEIDREFKSRRAEAKAEIDQDGASDELSDPNSGWLRGGKSNN